LVERERESIVEIGVPQRPRSIAPGETRSGAPAGREDRVVSGHRLMPSEHRCREVTGSREYALIAASEGFC